MGESIFMGLGVGGGYGGIPHKNSLSYKITLKTLGCFDGIKCLLA